jgi:hypothetical protein
MRRALFASVGLFVLAVGLKSSAFAVERELAGVRLGETALALLSKPGFGEPNYIGPIGTVGLPAAEPQSGRAAPSAARAARSGPVGPGAGRMGGAAAGARMGPAARGGGMGMRGPMAGERGAMGAGARGAMGGARGGAAASRTTTAGAARAQGGGTGMFWYYSRPGGTVMVLSLDPRGEIVQITLTGNAPYSAGRTSRNIGLTSSYMDIISRYGYPDQSAVQGAALQLSYIDHGVRFRLQSMRVSEIAIGAQVTAGAAPAAPPAAPEAPPAGISVEELRGYL